MVLEVVPLPTCRGTRAGERWKRAAESGERKALSCGGATAYMPGKLVVESGRERKELKTGSVKRKSARGRMGVGGKRREGKPSKRKSLTPKGMKPSQPTQPSQPSQPSQLTQLP